MNRDGSRLGEDRRTALPSRVTDHVYFTELVVRVQLDEDAVDRMASGDDAIIVMYGGPEIDSDGAFVSLVKSTIVVRQLFKPKKLVRQSVKE